mmetsp:Transcript_7391/g.18331  ORF Transcript_7391/g.18331 Transcript_7391/m.18331 type:complete len:203 (-) Transcript_7391:180-788(-)
MDAHRSPSSLFAKMTISRLRSDEEESPPPLSFSTWLIFLSHRIVSERSDVTPSLASNMSNTRSLSLAASIVCRIIAASIPILFLFPNAASILSPSTPAVSISRKYVPPIRPTHSRRSRVVPATGVTMAPPARRDGARYPIRPRERCLEPRFFSDPSLYARLDSLHIRRLKRVDFPALGGPRMDTTRSASAFVLIVLRLVFEG